VVSRRMAVKHDVVIVGAGPSSMGLAFGLLSKYEKTGTLPNFTIAIIDRGPIAHESSVVEDPKQWFKASHYSPSSSTVYLTKPQKPLGNRIISVPTGSGFGGGTNINACLVARPAKDDFDHWPCYWTEDVAVGTFGSDDERLAQVTTSRIMASVEAIETEMEKNGALIHETLHKRGDLLGKDNIFHSFDEDDPTEDSFELSIVTSAMKSKVSSTSVIKKYSRVNYYQALLQPLLDRNQKLKDRIYFYAETQVERILFGESKNGDSVASGVECSRGTSNEDGTTKRLMFRIMAAKKVILCAGAIHSPALLLLAGIGGGKESKQAGSSPQGPHREWHSVGKHIKDHPILMKAFLCRPDFFPTYSNGNPVRGWLQFDILKKDNAAAVTESEPEKSLSGKRGKSRVLFKVMDGSSSSHMIPDAIAGTFKRDFNDEESHCSSALLLSLFLGIIYHIFYLVLRIICTLPPIQWTLSRCTAQVLICLLNPDSEGQIKIERKKKIPNTEVPLLSHYDIIVDPAYLEQESDIERLESAWNTLDKVSCSWLPKRAEIFPGYLFHWLWNSSLKRFAADMVLPYFHWSGGCVIKTSLRKDYVVDEDLKVCGVKNLHVCDASILPDSISAPPSLTVTSIGYTAASIFHKELTGKRE